MKKLIFIFLVVLFLSCNYKEEVSVKYFAPSWTSDNKIVFIEIYWYQKYREGPIGTDLVENREIGYLWEVDTNQVYRRIAKLWDSEYNLALTNTTSALDWVAFSILGEDGEYEIWVIRRDGTGLRRLTKGNWPDFSPDAKKIVFERDDGLYIINIDGTGEHRIVNDPRANYPDWSSDGGRIAYVIFSPVNDNLIIIDTMGNFLNSYNTKIIAPDWGPIDSNAISFNNWDYGCILHLTNGKIDTFYTENTWEGLFLWSPSGNLFLRNTTVIKYDGTTLFKINPKGKL
ncbi:MAG: hypothetical protein ABIN73_02325 [candidate division WOR-3 bacterium]